MRLADAITTRPLHHPSPVDAPRPRRAARRDPPARRRAAALTVEPEAPRAHPSDRSDPADRSDRPDRSDRSDPADRSDQRAPELTAERITRVLAHGSIRQREALVDALPPHPLRDTVRTLMRSSCPGTPLAALAALARTYCRESSPETGTTLAAALHALGRQLAPKLPDGDLVAVALSQLATAHLGALARLARFDELVRFAGQYLAVLAPEDEEGAAVLRLFQLTATMALEREAAAAG